MQFRDARTARKPANRAAQITIWDVLSLSVSEGEEAGNIEMGQRFMVSTPYYNRNCSLINKTPLDI